MCVCNMCACLCVCLYVYMYVGVSERFRAFTYLRMLLFCFQTDFLNLRIKIRSINQKTKNKPNSRLLSNLYPSIKIRTHTLSLSLFSHLLIHTHSLSLFLFPSSITHTLCRFLSRKKIIVNISRKISRRRREERNEKKREGRGRNGNSFRPK